MPEPKKPQPKPRPLTEKQKDEMRRVNETLGAFFFGPPPKKRRGVSIDPTKGGKRK